MGQPNAASYDGARYDRREATGRGSRRRNALVRDATVREGVGSSARVPPKSERAPSRSRSLSLLQPTCCWARSRHSHHALFAERSARRYGSSNRFVLSADRLRRSGDAPRRQRWSIAFVLQGETTWHAACSVYLHPDGTALPWFTPRPSRRFRSGATLASNPANRHSLRYRCR